MRIAKCELKRLFELFDLTDDRIEVRPVPGIEFGMEQFSIGANLKGTPTGGDESERFDAFAEVKNFGRQTDGLWRVVSNHAIFDRDFGFHPVMLLSGKNGTEVDGNGQGARFAGSELYGGRS